MSYLLHPHGGTERSKRVPAIAALFFIFHALSSFAQQTVEVIVQNYRFQPQEVQVQPGDTVNWLNREKRTSHSIVFSDANGGESDRFFPEESWQRRFDVPGTYPYQCGPHPEMTGKVIVLASSQPITCNKEDIVRQVRIGPDTQSVEIIQENSSTKYLILRPGLLPEVHYLNKNKHALLTTRDGWILRLDLERAQQIAETKLNATVSSTALSAPRAGQDNLLAVASKTPGALIILDENLQVLKTLPAIDKTGRIQSGLLRVRTAASRDSFITLLADAAELWEVSYNPKSPEIGLGMVHDFQYREGHFVPGYLNPQRSVLPSLAQDFVLLSSGHEALTVHGPINALSDISNTRLHVTHLDVRKTENQSTPRFLPQSTESDWLQVDPLTLLQSETEPMLQVIKSTLRFDESPLKSAKLEVGPVNPHLACIPPP